MPGADRLIGAGGAGLAGRPVPSPSPAALATVAPDPVPAPDRLSARWLLALAAQLVRDVGDLVTASARAHKRLATFAMDGAVRFASAADRAAFTQELTAAVTCLVT